MWIKIGDGRVVLIHHEAHIKRLLGEGGIEVPDPTVKQAEQAQESETVDASQANDVTTDSTRKADDQRPSRRKPTVR